MKTKSNFFRVSGILLTMSLSLVSCNNDSDEPESGGGITSVGNVSKVLPLGVPRSVDAISNMLYDGSGRLLSCKYYEENVQFSYNGNTVVIKYIDSEGQVDEICTCTLGSNGFIKTCEADYGDDDKVTFYLDYDAAGHLTRSYYSNEYGSDDCKIIYNEDGDIVRVEDYREDCEYGNNTYINEISYTGNGITEPIENRSGIMFFDECFYIDLDEFIVAYYAGLLGVGTTHYPIVLTSPDDEDRSTFTWNIDNDGKPTSMIERTPRGDYSHTILWK